jgi:hypothetical protein
VDLPEQGSPVNQIVNGLFIFLPPFLEVHESGEASASVVISIPPYSMKIG